MSNTVTRNIINEGSSKLIIQVVIEGDGSGELSNFSVLDPAADFNPKITNAALSIMQIWASSQFDVLLTFDGVQPTKSWIHTTRGESHYDFRYFGGLRDYTNEDPTGQLLLSTTGIDAGLNGMLIIELKKN